MKQVIKSLINMILMKSIFCNDEHEIISSEGLEILSLQSAEVQSVADNECENKCCDNPYHVTGGKGGTVYCNNCYKIIRG